MPDISKIKLVFPNTQDEAETKAIYEEFKRTYPEEFSQWREIERRGVKPGEDPLHPYAQLVREFLFRETDCDSVSATTSVFMAMRMLILEEIR